MTKICTMKECIIKAYENLTPLSRMAQEIKHATKNKLNANACSINKWYAPCLHVKLFMLVDLHVGNHDSLDGLVNNADERFVHLRLEAQPLVN